MLFGGVCGLRRGEESKEEAGGIAGLRRGHAKNVWSRGLFNFCLVTWSGPPPLPPRFHWRRWSLFTVALKRIVIYHE